MEEIRLDQYSTGVIVFAKGHGFAYDDWLILVSRAETRNLGEHINYFICINLNTNEVYFNESGICGWGYTTWHDLYSPTKEQKMKVINALAERGYKYTPIWRKLIKQKNNGKS